MVGIAEITYLYKRIFASIKRGLISRAMSRFTTSKGNANIRYSLLFPAFASLGEDGLEVAFKQRTGVLEVLFGVGLGAGEAGKRLVQHADDPLLFRERRDGNRSHPEVASTNPVSSRAGAFLGDRAEIVV